MLIRGKEASRQKQEIDRQPTLFTHFPLNPLGTATGILSSISIIVASVHFFVLREPQNRCGSRLRRVFFPLAQPLALTDSPVWGMSIEDLVDYLEAKGLWSREDMLPIAAGVATEAYVCNGAEIYW